MPLDEIIEASIDKDKAPEPTGGATTEPEKPASTARPDLDPARKRTQKLHVAAMLDKREEIESLLSSGEVDVDAADVAHGFTALTTAARYGHVDLCRYLLAKGANPLHKDNEGRTILEFAQFANTQLPEELPALLSSALPRRIKVLSWNIAAINLNPFEYWMTHPDPAYTKMMEDVEAVMMSPGEADVPVAEVFTQAMFDELQVLMGKEGWPCEAECAEAYKELATRPIVSGFLKDKDLGSKRLMSMPDRMTNTIDTADGKPTCRPTVISSFAGDMGTVENWWPLWSAFLFQDAVSIPGKKGADPSSKRPCELLSPIPRAKYPALSEAEEAMSLRLQTVCLAVFDAVLVHLLKSLMEPKAEEEEKAAEGEKAADAAEVPKRPQQPSKWVQLKKGILAALVTAKEPRITQMLKKTHRGAQIIFLQEVRGKMASEALPSALEDYAVLSPATPSKAEQNSLILIEKGFFDASTVVDLSAEAMAACAAAGGTLPSAGDLLVVSVAAVDGSRCSLPSTATPTASPRPTRSPPSPPSLQHGRTTRSSPGSTPTRTSKRRRVNRPAWPPLRRTLRARASPRAGASRTGPTPSPSATPPSRRGPSSSRSCKRRASRRRRWRAATTTRRTSSSSAPPPTSVSRAARTTPAPPSSSRSWCFHRSTSRRTTASSGHGST